MQYKLIFILELFLAAVLEARKSPIHVLTCATGFGRRNSWSLPTTAEVERTHKGVGRSRSEWRLPIRLGTGEKFAPTDEVVILLTTASLRELGQRLLCQESVDLHEDPVASNV